MLEPASNLPWRLCRGDLDENIDEIASLLDPPEEPCTSNIWHLIQEGFSKHQLKLVLEALGECPWSSLPAEQQHASVSLLHRWHPEYGIESLVCRSLMHQVVRVLPQTSKLDRHISRVVKKLRVLSNKVPEKASGSHMLVQALVRVVRGRKDHSAAAGCYTYCTTRTSEYTRGVSSEVSANPNSSILSTLS